VARAEQQVKLEGLKFVRPGAKAIWFGTQDLIVPTRRENVAMRLVKVRMREKWEANSSSLTI
jgi:hypothetical protein